MHPLRNGSQATERPPLKLKSGEPGWFTESGENNVPSYPGADWFNHTIAELQNAMADNGVIFDEDRDDHLQQLFANLNGIYSRVFPTMAVMLDYSKAKDGQLLKTLGKVEVNDGGGRDYYVNTVAGIELPNGLYATEVKNGTVRGVDGRSYRVVACGLRQDSAGSGWYAIDDENHLNAGLSQINPVEVVDGDLRLNFDFNAGKIGTLTATSDENYSETKLTFGFSVATNYALLSICHPFEARLSGTAVAVSSFLGIKGGIWDYSYNINDGTYTFTHPVQRHSDFAGYPVSVSMESNGSNDGIGVAGISKSGFTLQTLNRIAGRVNANLGVVTVNAGVTSAAWVSDTLTITHPPCGNAEAASVISALERYNASVISSTKTTILVKFWDLQTGAAYTGVAPPAAVRYMRGSNAPSTISGELKASVSRGPVKLNVVDVFSSTGNIWVYGLFEEQPDA